MNHRVISYPLKRVYKSSHWVSIIALSWLILVSVVIIHLPESFPCPQLLSKTALLSPTSSIICHTDVFLLKFFSGVSEGGSEKQKLGLAWGTRIA